MKGMTYSEAIKQGFKVANRNWQLVLVRIALTVLSCIGFFFIVAIPLVIALLIIGISPVFLSRIESSPDILLTQYFGIVIVGGLLLLIYILIVSSVGLYAFAAAAGTIARTVRDESQKFSMKVFFEEGKRLFSPMLGFVSIMGLFAIGIILFYGASGALVAVAITYAKSQSLSLSMFLGVFFALIGVIAGFFIFFGLLSLTVYGLAAISLKGSRPVAAVKETINYLLKNPSAFYLYAIMASFYIIFSLILALAGLPLKAVPFIGLILSLPYQLLIYALQGYAGLLILAAAFVYYYQTELSSLTEDSGATEVIEITEGEAL
ncbi:hypothetical protein BMS3Bbin07_00923 [bacterium BMS3Bbin07]|nr:hypothetical protein BMS3Bbin07_00923 [bacterium BMS3Bbin07]